MLLLQGANHVIGRCIFIGCALPELNLRIICRMVALIGATALTLYDLSILDSVDPCGYDTAPIS